MLPIAASSRFSSVGACSRRPTSRRRRPTKCGVGIGRPSGGDLHLGFAAEFPMQSRREQPHQPMTVDVGEQDRQVGAGTPEPAREVFADDRSLDAHFDEIEEGAVRTPDDAFAVDHDEAVRHALHQCRRSAPTRSVSCRATVGRRGASWSRKIGPGSELMSEARTIQAVLLAAEMHDDAGSLAVLAHAEQHRVERLTLRRGKLGGFRGRPRRRRNHGQAERLERSGVAPR